MLFPLLFFDPSVLFLVGDELETHKCNICKGIERSHSSSPKELSLLEIYVKKVIIIFFSFGL